MNLQINKINSFTNWSESKLFLDDEGHGNELLKICGSPVYGLVGSNFIHYNICCVTNLLYIQVAGQGVFKDLSESCESRHVSV